MNTGKTFKGKLGDCLVYLRVKEDAGRLTDLFLDMRRPNATGEPMIFIQAATEPTMILMLAEKDLQTLREGRTLFVDERQTGGTRFNRVVLSGSKTDQDSLELIRRAGHDVSRLRPEAQPAPTEGRCDECKGCIAEVLLFEGKCNVCWATIAKKLMTQSG